jgi:hypothetical protein
MDRRAQIIKLGPTAIRLAQDFGLPWRSAMFPITLRIACVRPAPGVYRLYDQSRWVGDAVTVDSEALYVSHSFTESGRVVGSLHDAARWLEAIEAAAAGPRAAA